MIADMQAEIERLQARVAELVGLSREMQNELADGDEAIKQGIRRDRYREQLLRECEEMLSASMWSDRHELVARIRAELGDGA